MTDVSIPADTPPDEKPPQPTGKTTRRVMKRLVRDPVSALALAFLVIVVVAAILAPWLAPFEPTELGGPPAQPPSWEHLAGTDEVGRDIFSRIIYGARVSLSVGLIAPMIALVIGVPWGLASGYFGGKVDTISMRIMDGLLAFPALILAMATVAVLRPNLRNVMLAIGVVYIPRFARLVRAEVLRVKQQEYVSASLASGASDAFIMRRTVFPNVAPIITVQFTLSFATAVLAEAGLSFLGLGAQPPTPSWGGMLSVARNYLDLAPLYSVFVGAAIFLTVLSMSLVGDALRDVIDPRRRS